MFNFEPFIVEHVSPDVRKQRSANGNLDIFYVSNGQEPTIRTWAEAVKDDLLHWQSGSPCLVLHDLHKSGALAFGPTMQADFQELFQLRPELERYVAVVMPADFSAEIARLDVLVRELQAEAGYPVHWKVFTSRGAATRWLLGKLF